MNSISYEIYNFTKKFLKLQKIKLSPKDGLLLIAVLCGILSMVKIFSKSDSVPRIFLVLVIIISFVYLFYYVSAINKENEKKNFLDIHSKRYAEYQSKFAEKYGEEYGQKLNTYLKYAKDELEVDIKNQIEKSKYQLDKIVNFLTLTPLLTVFISFGKINENSQYSPDFVIYSIFLLFSMIIVVHLWISHIYLPNFSPMNDVANRQKVLSFLNGYIASSVFESTTKMDIDPKEIEIMGSDNAINETLEKNIMYTPNNKKTIMKSRLFYREKTANQLVLNILWGGYSHRIIDETKHIKILWGLIDSKFPYMR